MKSSRKNILAFALLASIAAGADAADVDTVRAQFHAYYTGAGADPSSPRMRRGLDELESLTRQITGPTWLRSDGSWYDINYNETPNGGWGPWDHTRRLIVMAKAYRTPGQGMYRNPALRAQIDAALAYTKTFYGATIFPAGNWWFWTIGIPIDLGPTLVLMEGEVDPQVHADLLHAMQLRIGNSPTGRGITGPIPTGQNLVWSSFTHLCLGILKNDAPMLAAVRDAMDFVVKPTSGEGIKRDRSFHQHGAQLYTGGYGGSFANDVARYALLTRGTSYGLPAESLASFSDYVADGIAWTLYGSYFDVSVISREVARPSTTGFNGIAALLQTSQIASPRASEIRAAASKMLGTWGALPSELAALASKVEASRFPSAWPNGHRHYFASDYTVHRRDGWFASVKMFSTRTKSGESTNEENLRGARQSDGRFYLVQRGDEYFGRDIWPALDWTRLPGTTVEQKADTASNAYGYGTRTFAGGTGDGRNGVSAMELAPLQSALIARKSWFFFDDAIVFLTNSITSTSTNRIETIVNQWPLLNANAQLARRDDWAVLENVGYWFPTPVDLKVTRESRTGTWASLGGSADATPHTKSFVTMWLDHGTSPVNASAEYVIVPNMTSTSMAAWAASRPLSIVANNDTVSAARDHRTGALGIAFWRAGAVEGIQSSAAAVVYITTPTSTTMRIDAADPNANASGTLQLTLPGAWRTSDVASFRNTRSTMLTIPRKSGETVTIHLQKVQGRRRAVSH
ncbi:MAG TPA: polysaccharide lyase family 8 super-sandwich domain-containing protein [Thermoanaerobaculia bacterium]|nr:polysaccharide lyase family 8 super-sandwich domain-containing protein [Thermoanaerobaculia bacterium]